MHKKLLYFLTTMLIGAIVVRPLGANVTKPLWCIVGGSRGAGYALAQNLCNDHDVSCTLFVRHDSAQKIKKLLGNTAHPPKIVEGDVTRDLTELITATVGAKYLVIAQTFPYAIWEESFQAMVLNCIAAAKTNGATLIYYGRAQRYGLVNPITETSQAQPNSQQGIVLHNVEKLLEASAIPTIIIHHSYPFGLHAGDGLLDKNLSAIPFNKSKSWYQSKQKFEWIGSDAVELQVTYLPDLAAFTRLIVTKLPVNGSPCFTINFAGLHLKNINELGSLYCKIANVPYELNLHSKSKLVAASFVTPEAKSAVDSFDSFTHTILYSRSFQESFCPFELTPLATALEQIYASYTSYATAH